MEDGVVDKISQQLDSKNINRKESSLRWLVLILCAFSTFGNYYCIDNVGVLHGHLKEYLGETLHKDGKDLFEYYFGLLYSLYSFPNIILPLLGGYLIIKLGNRTIYLIVGIFLVLGQFLFYKGCLNKNINLMLAGRVIFGFGGEIININQNIMLIKWFKKEEISFPFALTITVSRLGSVLNDVYTPQIASNNTVALALMAGWIIVIISFLCSVILCFFDQFVDGQVEEEVEIVDLSSISNLRYIFWILAMICVCLYGGFLPFNNIASAFLTATYFKDLPENEARNKAGVYMSIPFIIGIFFVPLFGYLIDKFGKRAHLSLLSAILGLFCFFLFITITPLIPLIILGLTYSLFASVIWPSIAIVTTKEMAGLAFGISTSIQNAGLALFPVIVAYILTETKNNYYLVIFLISLLLFL